MSTKQLNVTLPAEIVNKLKKHCYMNGITLAGLFRDLIPRVMAENIPLNLQEIRRKDFEYRNQNTTAQGSRF